MKKFTITDINKLCHTHQRTIDKMIWKSVLDNLAEMKNGLQQMYALFKLKKNDHSIYLMFINVNRKDEENVHCDIVSITRYDSAFEYNKHVELSQ